MDLTRPVTYRGANLNTVTPQVGKPGISGCMVESAGVTEISYTGFTEKRRVADGQDAIEPYLALHKLVLRGTVFGPTRGQTFDALRVLRHTFSPTEALRESPGTKGFLPFVFSEAATRTYQCRPMGLRWSLDAMRHGSNANIPGQDDAVALGIQWQAELLVGYASLCNPDGTPILPWPPAPLPSGIPCFGVHGGPTPAGHYPPLSVSGAQAGNDMYSAPDGYITYNKPGDPYPYNFNGFNPYPNFFGGWHFAAYGLSSGATPSGRQDQWGTLASNSTRCLLIGNGHATIYIPSFAGGAVRGHWELWHEDPANPGSGILDATGDYTAPTQLEFDITGGPAICGHMVILMDGAGNGGGKIGFGGFTWTPS